jgi:adhesin transport system outer membrane protein
VRLFIIILWLLFCPFVNALDAGLSLDDAMTLAISHPNIQGKKQELEGAKQKLETSSWQRFPSLSVQSSQGQSSINRNNAEVVTTFRIEQPLWAGGKISGAIDATRQRLNAASLAVDETQIEILIKTATAYYGIIKLQDKINASTENVAEHQRLLELIQRRARSEISPMSEIILAKARLDQAKTENIQLKASLINTRIDLENLIGREVKTLNPKKMAILLPNDELSAVKDALNFSPTLKKLTAESGAADSDITVAQAGLWPQLSARSDQTLGGILDGNNTTYLALTYLPGNGLSTLSASREALAKKEVAETAIRSMQLNVSNEVRSDWNQYFSEQSQSEVLFNLTEVTRGIYESYIRQYEAGKKTWIELLNARKEATQAKYQLADSESNAFILGLKLQIYTGMLNQTNSPARE